MNGNNYRKERAQFQHIIPVLDRELAKHDDLSAQYFVVGFDGFGDSDSLIFYKDKVICNLEGWNWGNKSWGSTTRLKHYTERLKLHVQAGSLKLHSAFSSHLIFTGGAPKQHCMSGYVKAGWTIHGHTQEFKAHPSRSQIKWLKNVIRRLVKRLVGLVTSNVSYKRVDIGASVVDVIHSVISYSNMSVVVSIILRRASLLNTFLHVLYRQKTQRTKDSMHSFRTGLLERRSIE